MKTGQAILLTVFTAAVTGAAGYRIGTLNAPAPKQETVEKAETADEKILDIEGLMDSYCAVTTIQKFRDAGLRFPIATGQAAVTVSTRGVLVESPAENLTCFLGPGPENPEHISIRCDQHAPAPSPEP